MQFKERKWAKPIFDLTPLVDIVFLLLIFFMLTSSFVEVKPGVKVNLPQASAPNVGEKNDVTVSIDINNTLYLNNRVISPKDLYFNLSKLVKVNPNILAIVEADKTVTHGKVVRVM
ncbi:MAG TPA: biopolymer transporter ExbD, partial [Candidatus Atribacteria bacterium]|nr:biopolymer transporter ExbD [Candidatus Atribacteria bacterium]